MAKVQVQLPASSFPQQVDVPVGAERSVQGALHFRPGSAKWITSDELAYIQAHKPALAKKLRVISEEVARPEPKARESVDTAAAPTSPQTYASAPENEKTKHRSRGSSKRGRDKD